MAHMHIRHLLWNVPRGGAHVVAILRELILDVLAPVHGTYAHSRVLLTPRCSLSASTIGRRSRTHEGMRCPASVVEGNDRGKQMSILPARFLQPWEVLQIYIQDKKMTSSSRNRYLLVVVDGGTTVLAAFTLRLKEVIRVSSELVELLLIFGVPLSIRCEPGGEFIADVTDRLCRWLVSFGDGPTNHPRARGAVRRLRGWLQEMLTTLCTLWPLRREDYLPAATWINCMEPDASLPGGASPY